MLHVSFNEVKKMQIVWFKVRRVNSVSGTFSYVICDLVIYKGVFVDLL